MEITGKVVRILPMETGQGRNGEWRKQQFVIEIESGQFPKNICFVLWGDKIEQAALAEGEAVKVFFDVESREFNGRWYTDVKAWRVDKAGAAVAGAPAQSAAPVAEAYNNPPLEASGADDLPF